MKATSYLSIGSIALGLILVGCNMQTSGTSTQTSGVAPQKMERAQPSIAKVARRDIVGYRMLDGKIYIPPDAQASVVAATLSPIQSVDVKEGDHVARGEVLMTLATGQADAYTSAKTAYDAAKSAYSQALAQYEQPVSAVRKQLADARAAEKAARDNTQPGGDASELQSATDTRKQLEAELVTAQTDAKGNELTYKQQLDSAANNLENARKGKNASTITAPISGTVTAVTISPGQQPDGKTAVATIVDLGSIMVKADVMPEDANFVKRNGPVAIIFTNLPDHKFDGRVVKVDTLPADQDGHVRYSATISFKNTDGLVLPGSTIRQIGVVAGKKNGVIAVPVDAVAKDGSGKAVVRVQQPNGEWKIAFVELGLTDGNFVEVKSGVDTDDMVQVVPGQGQWLIKTAARTA